MINLRTISASLVLNFIEFCVLLTDIKYFSKYKCNDIRLYKKYCHFVIIMKKKTVIRLIFKHAHIQNYAFNSNFYIFSLNCPICR